MFGTYLLYLTLPKQACDKPRSRSTRPAPQDTHLHEFQGHTHQIPNLQRNSTQTQEKIHENLHFLDRDLSLLGRDLSLPENGRFSENILSRRRLGNSKECLRGVSNLEWRVRITIKVNKSFVQVKESVQLTWF